MVLAHLHRRLPAVGRLVRLSTPLRRHRRHAGRMAMLVTQIATAVGGLHLDAGRVDDAQSDRRRHLLGRGCGLVAITRPRVRRPGRADLHSASRPASDATGRHRAQATCSAMTTRSTPSGSRTSAESSARLLTGVFAGRAIRRPRPACSKAMRCRSSIRLRHRHRHRLLRRRSLIILKIVDIMIGVAGQRGNRARRARSRAARRTVQ